MNMRLQTTGPCASCELGAHRRWEPGADAVSCAGAPVKDVMKEGLQDLAKVAEHIKEAFTQSCGAPAPLPALPLPFRGSHAVVALAVQTSSTPAAPRWTRCYDTRGPDDIIFK